MAVPAAAMTSDPQTRTFSYETERYSVAELKAGSKTTPPRSSQRTIMPSRTEAATRLTGRHSTLRLRSGGGQLNTML